MRLQCELQHCHDFQDVRYITTASVAFDNNAKPNKGGKHTVLEVTNFFDEMDKVRRSALLACLSGSFTLCPPADCFTTARPPMQDRKDGPEYGKFGSALPSHQKTEWERHLQTTYRREFCSSREAPAAEAAPARPVRLPLLDRYHTAHGVTRTALIAAAANVGSSAPSPRLQSLPAD